MGPLNVDLYQLDYGRLNTNILFVKVAARASMETSLIQILMGIYTYAKMFLLKEKIVTAV